MTLHDSTNVDKTRECTDKMFIEHSCISIYILCIYHNSFFLSLSPVTLTGCSLCEYLSREWQAWQNITHSQENFDKKKKSNSLSMTLMTEIPTPEHAYKCWCRSQNEKDKNETVGRHVYS